MSPARVIQSGIDRDTGYPVELRDRGDFVPFGAGQTFWFAYPDRNRNPYQGASGDTKAQAVAAMLAKQETRHAA
ncbi:hypothetical protein [Sphingomonas sp. Leaf10]|uniref:hypothetical protein n=1 Tax=Sphingomonas sp. Leaf10 TaxID=1735676 RepID=UPI000AB784D7|nr:hypothetical protein [Sphingomonas sp. Leaf10]